LVRPASTERMLGPNGQPVTDSNVELSLNDLRKRIRNVLGGGAK
jgi:hypothetical protein